MGSHDWIPSTLGHGETMCRNCKITNREAAVLGQLNDCDAAPPMPDPRTEKGERLMEADLDRIVEAFRVKSNKAGGREANDALVELRLLIARHLPALLAAARKSIEQEAELAALLAAAVTDGGAHAWQKERAEEAESRLTAALTELDTLRAQVERQAPVLSALNSVLAACDRGRLVTKPGCGAGGMTIEANYRASNYNGVDAWTVEEARGVAMEATAAPRRDDGAGG